METELITWGTSIEFSNYCYQHGTEKWKNGCYFEGEFNLGKK